MVDTTLTASGDDCSAALTGVTVSFPMRQGDANAKTALADVSLRVRRGELLVLVGRSGCGKTTVLNLLAGLIPPSAGSVDVLGGPAAGARDRIAYMFARDALLQWRTAIRNVEFALELRHRGLGRGERRERAQKLLDEVGVGNARGLYPWQLSQGMRQRVALARTWAVEPELLLMDEPFAALDAQTRIDVQAKFLEVWSRNRKTCIFVTHDLAEAIVLGDRVIVLDDGRVIDEVAVPIARPRDALRIIDEPLYHEIHARLVSALFSRGTRAPETVPNQEEAAH